MTAPVEIHDRAYWFMYKKIRSSPHTNAIGKKVLSITTTNDAERQNAKDLLIEGGVETTAHVRCI